MQNSYFEDFNRKLLFSYHVLCKEKEKSDTPSAIILKWSWTDQCVRIYPIIRYRVFTSELTSLTWSDTYLLRGQRWKNIVQSRVSTNCSCSCKGMFMHRYVHVHVRSCTGTLMDRYHTFMHMFFHADVQSCTCTFMHSFVHALVRLFAGTFMQRYVHAEVRSCRGTFMQRYLHAEVCLCRGTSIQRHLNFHADVYSYTWTFLHR